MPEVQPSLEDLVANVSRIVANSDYDSRIKGNIDAALTLRLSNLALGGRRFLFSGTMSIPMEELLNRPTILEFSAIGDDEQKAFVLGAILLRLVHYRQVVGLSHGDLRHVTLIEEAHRLLRAVPETVGNEIANHRGKAVETFCNLLAELRAYGGPCRGGPDPHEAGAGYHQEHEPQDHPPSCG